MLEELKNLKALLNENIEKIELLNKENKDIEIKQIFINESLDILKKDLDFINEEEKDSKILSKYLNIALSISIVLSVFFLNMLFSLLLFLMGLFIKLIYNKLYKEDYLNYLKDLI